MDKVSKSRCLGDWCWRGNEWKILGEGRRMDTSVVFV